MSKKKMSKEAQVILDLIMPKLVMDHNMPTDKEASALYNLWKSSPEGTDVFSSKDKDMVQSWKIKGLVDGMSSSLALTDKGRKLIMDMVTNEPNRFDKSAESPRYNKIKAAQKDKKRGGKTGTKTAFNLRRSKGG